MRNLLILSGATLLLAGCGGQELTGPPCQSLTPQQASALGYTTREDTTMGTITVRRQYGSASCNQQSNDAARCDLSTPGLVHITANGQETYFQVTPGQPATVVIDRQGARCVVGRQPA